MGARPQPNPIELNQEIERELARRLDTAKAEDELVVVQIAGNRYCLVPMDDIQMTDDPAAHYDVAQVLAAIEAGAGAFKGMDVTAFLAEILAAREQGDSGRSA